MLTCTFAANAAIAAAYHVCTQHDFGVWQRYLSHFPLTNPMGTTRAWIDKFEERPSEWPGQPAVDRMVNFSGSVDESSQCRELHDLRPSVPMVLLEPI